MRYRSGGKSFRIKNTQAKDLPYIEELSIPPYNLGLIGGEMVRRMIETAENYLSEQAVEEVKNSFHRAFDREAPNQLEFQSDQQTSHPD